MAETESVARITGVVMWSNGTAVLRQGKPYEGWGRSILEQERPDLFVSAAEAAGLPSVPGVRGSLPNCRFWRCKEQFTPGPNQGAVQQYCKPECRKAREVELRKIARLVTKRNYPPVPSTVGRGAAKNIRAHVLEVESLIQGVRSLIENLGGRIWDHVPAPRADEAVLTDRLHRPLPESDRAGVLSEAWSAHTDLIDLLKKSRDSLESASRNEAAQAQVDRNWAWYQKGEKRRQELDQHWGDTLGEVEDEAQAATRKSLLQGIQ